MRGRAGRAPVLMKILSAVKRPRAADLEPYLDDVGTGEAGFAKNELDVLGIFQPMLPSLHGSPQRLPAVRRANLPHVNADRPAVNAIVGGAPSQVSDAGAGNHALRRRAASLTQVPPTYSRSIMAVRQPAPPRSRASGFAA